MRPANICKIRFPFLFFLLTFSYLFVSAQVPAVFDSLQLKYSDTLYFDSGLDILDSTAIASLRAFPSPKGSGDRIYLTGHTDAIGSLTYNEDLAKRRAGNAQALLSAAGWTDTAMLIQTFGERTPVVSNNNEANRSRNRRVTIDLYQATPFRALIGQVFVPDADLPVPKANVRVHSKYFTDTLSTDDQGRFELHLPVDSIVGIDVYAKGYFLSSKMLKMKAGTAPEIKFELKPAKAGAVAEIENLFFVGNEAILLQKSEPSLPKVLRFMQVNPHLKVEIAGHVNYPSRPPVTKGTFEWDLSVRRAKFVHDYLIEHGIAAAQLSFQGYGNHEMVYPEARSAEDQAANRRVEIRILGTLPEEEK